MFSLNDQQLVKGVVTKLNVCLLAVSSLLFAYYGVCYDAAEFGNSLFIFKFVQLDRFYYAI